MNRRLGDAVPARALALRAAPIFVVASLRASIAIAAYRALRWLSPKLPTRRTRDWAWARKWKLWHALYGPHECLWSIIGQPNG